MKGNLEGHLHGNLEGHLDRHLDSHLKGTWGALGGHFWGNVGSLRGYSGELAEAMGSRGHLQGHMRGAPISYSPSISLR